MSLREVFEANPEGIQVLLYRGITDQYTVLHSESDLDALSERQKSYAIEQISIYCARACANQLSS